ncbi:MAG: hypothetical protein RI932_2345 [Pseudomonadota bacterium]
MLTQKMHGLVLCAGFGTRLRPLTNVIPKPAVPVGALPAALRNVEQLLNAGFEQVHCNTHYLSEELERQMQLAALSRGWPGEKIRFWNEPDILETGGGIARIVRDFSAERGHRQFWDTLVVSGDIVADIPLEKMLNTWAGRSPEDAALMASLALKTPRKDVTWVDSAMKRVVGFGADSTPEAAAALGWHARVFSNHQILAGRVLERATVEKRSSIDIFYRRALKLGEKILHLSLDDASVWFDIGTPDSYFDCVGKLNLKSAGCAEWSRSSIQICTWAERPPQLVDHVGLGAPNHDQSSFSKQSLVQDSLSALVARQWHWLGHLHSFPETLIQPFEEMISNLKKNNGRVGETSDLFFATHPGDFLIQRLEPQSGSAAPQTPYPQDLRGFIDVPLPAHLGAHPHCKRPFLIPLSLLLGPTDAPPSQPGEPFWLLITPPRQ